MSPERASGGRRAPRARIAALLLALLATLPVGAAERGADGQFDRRRSSHFVLYQDVDIDRRSGWSGSIRFEREVLAALETAFRRLDDLLGLRPRRPITVTIWDPSVFDLEFAPVFRFPAAGFYQGTVHVRGETQVSAYLLHVLHHELLHAALDQAAPSFRFPGWLNEGLAEWFAYRALAKRHLHPAESLALTHASQAGSLHGLQTLAASNFGHLHPNDVELAYLQSYAFVEYLARRHGEDSLRELCDKLLRSRDLDRTLARVYRATLAELEADFRRELAAAR